MEEYEFRGINRTEGFVYGDLIHKRQSKQPFIHFYTPDGFECMYEVDPKTVGRFIQRINGFDIYVGDTVKAYKYGDKEKDPTIENIEYRNGTYMFGNWTWLEFLEKFRYVEVIGNIYEVTP